MNVAVSRTLSAVAELAWVASLVFRLVHPESPWCIYLANYNILMLILYWIVNAFLVLAVIGTVLINFDKSDAGKLSDLRKVLADARSSWYSRISRIFDFLVLLFLGISGISWWAFAALALYLALSFLLVAIVGKTDESAEKKPPPSDGVVH